MTEPTIKDHPLLMSAPMVLATKEGRKTMTRRIINPQPLVMPLGAGCWYPDSESKRRKYYGTTSHFLKGMALDFSPYKPGDHVWIKEDYIIHAEYREESGSNLIHGEYLADGAPFDVTLTDREWALFSARKYPFRKTPSRFMYKSLARLWRAIVSTPPERVQDISEEDAIKEGLRSVIGDGGKPGPGYKWSGPGYHDGTSFDKGKNRTYHVQQGKYCCCHEGQRLFLTPARCAFRILWDSIHGPGAWARNDYVWAISYEEIVVPGMAYPTTGAKTSVEAH